MTEEWTDWIEHDGKGCPCVGKYVQVDCGDRLSNKTYVSGHVIPCVTGERGWRNGDYPSCLEVIRYRIRKPRALQELIELVENLPVEVDA